ncbi:phospholipase B1, membrane-associated-like [Mercenaria mercenaria]|uniref:phospholipase B1, membrane-associated-like n=1 Tax=Mercenaria mercenaria TaxID=6596 RepID=UPI00234F4E94|nr:phospholipase B1, membrane-associated-like [Mercenaria mercenaria]
MIWIYCFICAIGFSSVGADYGKYADFIRRQAENETFVRLFEKHMSQFQDNDKNLRKSSTFGCRAFPQPAQKTSSVHKLRPMDVKVIGALGDSITAGTGITAKTVLGLLQENRGLSWSVGGDKSINEQQTIPNILKVYNPNIKGFSTGSGPVWWEPSSHLNIANPGDKSENMPDQAKTLVDRMKADKNINFEEDWKVITLFVGGNDLCDYCGKEKEKYRAENYVAHIQEALDYLHQNVPRAFVNLVEILDIFIVKTLNENIVCDTLHFFLCACAAFPANSDAEAELRAETERYRSLVNELVLTGRYDTRDDFTVVVQPFFSETHPPIQNGSPDLSYFAPDCFHLSLKGHRAAADALWNNMIEPIGKKRTKWTPGEIVECPSAEAPYFYTYKNSDSSNVIGNALGQLESQQEFDSNTDPDNHKSSQSGSSSVAMTTVATVVGVLIVAVVSVFALVAWKRRHSNKEERQILLQQRDSQYYAPI